MEWHQINDTDCSATCYINKPIPPGQKKWPGNCSECGRNGWCCGMRRGSVIGTTCTPDADAASPEGLRCVTQGKDNIFSFHSQWRMAIARK